MNAPKAVRQEWDYSAALYAVHFDDGRVGLHHEALDLSVVNAPAHEGFRHRILAAYEQRHPLALLRRALPALG